jgi:hypothetical protein
MGERPKWWSYPERWRALERCPHGHDWGPGRVIVGNEPCDCPTQTAAGQQAGSWTPVFRSSRRENTNHGSSSLMPALCAASAG